MREPDELLDRAAQVVNTWSESKTGAKGMDARLLISLIEQQLIEVSSAAFHKGVIFGQRPRNRISSYWRSWTKKRRLKRFKS